MADPTNPKSGALAEGRISFAEVVANSGGFTLEEMRRYSRDSGLHPDESDTLLVAEASKLVQFAKEAHWQQHCFDYDSRNENNERPY